MTDREKEIREKIQMLALAGRMAIARKDLKQSAELILEVQPLMRELAEITNDGHWNDLADEGTDLYNRRPRDAR